MPQEHSIHNPYTAEEIETALMALVAWAGNATAAARYLKAEKGLSIRTQTLSGWKQKHAIRYDELREKYGGQIEQAITNDLREVIMLGTQAERLAIEKATEALEHGTEKDPSRAAANMARVVQSSTDKLMTLTSRPVTITESRNIGEILRSLAAKGVIKVPEAQEAAPELEAPAP